jgi:hypothetical protein
VDFGEHVTVVVDDSGSITNDDASDEDAWFESPVNEADADAVPASVFAE